MRIPKLRGFKNRFKIQYEVVNVGAIAALAERGAFEGGEPEGLKAKSGKAAPPTVNQDILRAVGLVRTVSKPLKILGAGDLSTPLFVVADAFTKSAVAKIEAAGGTTSVLEVPTEPKPAIGVGEDGARSAREPRTAGGRAAAGRKVDARVARAADAAERASEAAAASTEKAAKRTKASKADDASDAADVPATDGTVDATDGVGPTTDADATAETDAPGADTSIEPGAADGDENA
jgi:ribosomal protein L15